MPSKEQLMQRIRQLEEENDRLQDQLDKVADIVAPPQEEGEEDSGESDLGNHAFVSATPSWSLHEEEKVPCSIHTNLGRFFATFGRPF